ncbi:MAG: hypothetical protein AAF404_02435, partial [Pseudomonadota bacterium]
MPQYAVTVDTEEEWDWDAGWPVTRHSLDNLACTPGFYELCRTHGARTTWFTNWSVMNYEPTRATVMELTDNTDAELGMHIHPWLTPPFAANDECGARDSFLHNSPSTVIHQKLETVWQVFADNGCRPKSFRGGRYSCSPEIQNYLQHPQRGFTADASVVPFTTWPDDGAPDYRHRNHLPRRVPPPRKNGTALWEIPVTLAYTRKQIEFWADTFNKIEGSFLRHLRLCGILSSSGVVRRVWLNFEATPPADIIALLAFLEKLEVPCVTLTLHSSSLMKGG